MNKAQTFLGLNVGKQGNFCKVWSQQDNYLLDMWGNFFSCHSSGSEKQLLLPTRGLSRTNPSYKNVLQGVSYVCVSMHMCVLGQGWELYKENFCTFSIQINFYKGTSLHKYSTGKIATRFLGGLVHLLWVKLLPQIDKIKVLSTNATLRSMHSLFSQMHEGISPLKYHACWL